MKLKMYHYYILVLLSLLLFLNGFFPITRPTKNVNSDPPTHINTTNLRPEIHSSDIKKTVIIIIDALRLDFVNTRYMPLTSNITIENGCFNTVTVETPTVTLPRIKALIAGNVPQFIDLVLNLASTEVLQDSLIHSLYKKRKKIVFYGDDTWLKLFPNYFARYEGTSSFFVRDFKEVDDNVTRNVNIELEKSDWDMMILHYLGLDHIGHVYGPFSAHIPGKLKEMDEIIYNIYSEMSKRGDKFLMIVTGDHGMRDSGGHGGASYSETHVPLLAVGINCVNDTFLQTDIPVNLAVLLGLNIPSTSIGQVRSNLLPISLEKYLFALRYNNLLLLDKADLCQDQFFIASNYHELYIRTFDERHAGKAIDLYRNCSSIISKYLTQSSVKQNFNSLVISILVMLDILLILVKNLVVPNCDYLLSETMKYFICFVIICIQFTISEHIYSVIFIIVLVIFLITSITLFIKSKNIRQVHKDTLKLFMLISIIHPITFFSSSFVEEEHQFWYSLNNLLIVYMSLFKNGQPKSVLSGLVLLSFFRFLRTINSTGDKWANYPDFSDWLLKKDNFCYHQIFFVLGLVTIFFSCVYTYKSKFTVNTFNFIILFCIFLLKTFEFYSVSLGKLVWFLILCHPIFFYDCPKVIIWILISSLLLKPYNVFLISYCILASAFILKTFQNTTLLTFCHFWLGNALYFAQGHSNSLASVDISIGYIGLSEYRPLIVILQVLFHTYALPVLCNFLIFRDRNIDGNKVWTILFCNRLYITIVTCVITITFRHHLFVWSVFAPKLVIEAVHLLSLFAVISIHLCFNKFDRFKLFVKNKL